MPQPKLGERDVRIHTIEVHKDGSVKPDRTPARAGDVVVFNSAKAGEIIFRDHSPFLDKKVPLRPRRPVRRRVRQNARHGNYFFDAYTGGRQPGDPCIIVEGGPD